VQEKRSLGLGCWSSTASSTRTSGKKMALCLEVEEGGDDACWGLGHQQDPHVHSGWKLRDTIGPLWTNQKVSLCHPDSCAFIKV